MLTHALGPNGKMLPARSAATATAHEAVTPSDTVGFTGVPGMGPVCLALWVGTGGNVAAVVGGVALVYANVASGTVLPISASRVNATNTTASGIVALF